MPKTWAIYSVSLLSTFIFFLCYKMWVAWFCLIVILMLPLLSLAMTVIASCTLTVKTELAGNARKGDPAYIRIITGGIASYFSFCRIRTEIIDHMAGTSRKTNLMIHDNGITELPVDTSHCGSYSYKMTKLEIFDLLGFFHINRYINKENEIFVKPSPSMPEYMPDMYGFKARNLRRSKQPDSEIYDIREYQTGDPVKSVHWKMSAKKEKLLVKEPLEEYGGYSRVILQLTDDRDMLDLHLGQILFTSRFFIDHETAHKIRVIPPDKSEISFDIESEKDLEKAMTSVLRMRIPDREASYAD